MITPEQAFKKWWDSNPGACGANRTCRGAFLAGIAYKELHQIGILADIRKAVGDGEGRLMGGELLERVKSLVKQVDDLQNTLDRAQLVVAGLSSAASVVTENQWLPIASAPKDGTEILGWRDDCGVFMVRYCSAEDFLTSSEMAGWSDRRRESFDWFCADFAHGDRLEGDLIPTHWMALPAGPVDSVMTEKEEGV